MIKDKIKQAESLLQANPGVNDLNVTGEWLADFRIVCFDLAKLYGQLKVNFSKHEIDIIKSPEYAKLKLTYKTVGQWQAYLESTFEPMEDLHTLKLLLEKYFPQVSSEYMTLMSASKRQQQ
jgi:hypothetical protein